MAAAAPTVTIIPILLISSRQPQPSTRVFIISSTSLITRTARIRSTTMRTCIPRRNYTKKRWAVCRHNRIRSRNTKPMTILSTPRATTSTGSAIWSDQGRMPKGNNIQLRM